MTLPQIHHLAGEPDFFPIANFQFALGGTQGPATGTTIEFADNSENKIVFKGSFTVVGSTAEGGTATGFDLYHGAVKLMTGSGYDLPYNLLLDAANAAELDHFTFFYSVFFSRVREVGSAMGDFMYGSMEKGKFYGNGGDDFMYGGPGKDVFHGGDGDDWLEGRGKLDKLFGDAGADTFAFTNADKNNDPAAEFAIYRVRDFSPGEDTIFLESARFPALVPGVLDHSVFGTGHRAETAEEHVIYRKSDGALFYDDDGAGGGKKVMIGELSPHLKLHASDFEAGLIQ